MKRILSVSTLSLAATSVFAADAVVYNEPAPVVADTFSWTGGYIGLNAGYAGGKFKHPFTITEGEATLPLNPPEPEITVNAVGDVIAGGSVDVTASGFVGGIQAGYNWQMNQTVIGIETDIQATNLKGELSGSIDGLGGLEVGTKVKWFGTTRVRLGYLPTERFMIYATGGIAYGKVETYGSTYDTSGDGAGFSSSKTRAGYTVGAGAEYAINDNWTLKSEYLYTDLGKNKFTLSNNFTPVNVESKSAFHTVRVGVNYKF